MTSLLTLFTPEDISILREQIKIRDYDVAGLALGVHCIANNLLLQASNCTDEFDASTLRIAAETLIHKAHDWREGAGALRKRMDTFISICAATTESVLDDALPRVDGFTVGDGC